MTRKAASLPTDIMAGVWSRRIEGSVESKLPRPSNLRWFRYAPLPHPPPRIILLHHEQLQIKEQFKVEHILVSLSPALSGRCGMELEGVLKWQ